MFSRSRIDPSIAPALLRRLGVGGFLFFLAKGLLWLSLPYLGASLFH